MHFPHVASPDLAERRNRTLRRRHLIDITCQEAVDSMSEISLRAKDMATSILSKGGSLLRCGLASHLFRSMTRLSHEQYLPGFYYWPNYFTDEEQRILVAASLYKLDGLESRQARKQRNNYWMSNNASPNNLNEMFAPDELYEFEEGHYDGVIHQYREMHLSSWPVEEFKGLKPILERLYLLCPTPLVQTHLLHLGSHGYILPHIDNVDSSGSWILGVSLGAERTLRMRAAENTTEGKEFHIKLLSGSVYLQRDDVRYRYLHSITRDQAGQRLSIVIRDQKTSSIASP